MFWLACQYHNVHHLHHWYDCAARSPTVTTSWSALDVVPPACASQGTAVSLAVAFDYLQQFNLRWLWSHLLTEPLTPEGVQCVSRLSGSPTPASTTSCMEAECVWYTLGQTNLIFCVTDFSNAGVTRQAGGKRKIILKFHQLNFDLQYIIVHLITIRTSFCIFLKMYLAEYIRIGSFKTAPLSNIQRHFDIRCFPFRLAKEAQGPHHSIFLP